MANTLFLKDGTTEVIFNENPTEEFARIIYERLGKDAEDMFNFIEASLEAANSVLNDIYSECDYLDFALKQIRVDRKEAQKAVDRIRKEIENVL